MIDTVLFTSPIIIVLVAVASLLHIAAAVPTALGVGEGVKKPLSVILAVLNILAHIALFATALIMKAKAEELFLAVMISAAVGMLSVYISEAVAKKRSGKENNDGI